MLLWNTFVFVINLFVQYHFILYQRDYFDILKNQTDYLVGLT